jgi:hypothetical protein
MPSSNLWGLEWLNANAQRSYPLSDSATKLDTSGTFSIPDSFLLGLYFPVNSSINIEAERFFIYSISVFATGVSLVLGYDDGAGNVSTVAETVVPLSTHTEYRSYSLVGSGDFSDSVGKAVFGKTDDLQKLPAGQYFFNYAAGKLDTDCVRPVIRGVSSIVLVNGNDRTEKLNGVIELVAGTNMQLSVTYVTGQPTQIRFDAISGEGLSKTCICTNDDTQVPCIRTINGIPPTAAGDFTLLSDECIQLTSQTNGIQIKDVCSKPCCGCTELQAVTQDLTRFGDASLSLQNYLNRLEGSVNRMNLTVLGSRLGDSACVQ